MSLKTIYSSLLATAIMCLTISCVKHDVEPERDGDQDGSAISNSLHIAFETPDWKRHIDCSHLDLNPSETTVGVYFVSASSASTHNTFILTYPKHASELDKAGNIKKYPAGEFGPVSEPFRFALKLPLDAGKFDLSYGRLVSKAGQSETEFTEITEIKRVTTDGNYVVFEIKGRYGFNTTLVKDGESLAGKYVKGTFKLKVSALNE